jgi:hypothetical protein
MALSRAGIPASGRGIAFEALEARLVLSAPTLTPLAPEASMTRLVLPIQYHSDSPIDLTSIGDGDIGVTGPNGFSQMAQLLAPPAVLSNGDVVARYVVRPPTNQWEWPAANGTYNVGIVAGAVRNTAGEANAAGGAGSWWLWFNTPRITSSGQQVFIGPGLPGTLANQAEDEWIFTFQLAYPVPVHGAGALEVHVTGPHGLDTTAFAVYPYFLNPRETISSATLQGIVKAPGGTWDFTDSGAYTVQVASVDYDQAGVPHMRDVISTQAYALDFVAPRAELVSTSVGVRDLTATVRYTAAPGATISAASISNSDISLTSAYIGTVNPELLGLLAQAPTTNADGSVTAVYRVMSPSSGGWSFRDNGPYAIHTRFHQVLDSAGRPVGAGTIGQRTLTFDRPSVIGLHTLAAASIAWDVEVSFRNVGALIDTSRLPGIDVYTFDAGFGQYMPTPGSVQLLSFSNSSDNILTVRYRILPPTGGILRDTNYHLVYGAARLLGNPYDVIDTQYASLDMHFAGAAVMGLRTLSRTATAWDVELDYSNPRGVISTGSLGTQNLLIAAPGGRMVRLSMLGFATGADQVLRVRYRVLAATNGGTLARGTYGFSLRSGSVFAAGVALPGQVITSLTI